MRAAERGVKYITEPGALDAPRGAPPGDHAAQCGFFSSLVLMVDKCTRNACAASSGAEC